MSNTFPKINKNRPVTVALVGAGNRSLIYGDYALRNPDRMKVAAVAEPDPVRRRQASELFSIPAENQFLDYQSLAAAPKLADAAINGTMDRLHFDSSILLMRAGYDLLLEKPIAPTEFEVRELIRCATREYGRTVIVCHVLRYAPFYREIKRLLDSGRIGRILAMHTSENVGYAHMASAFVRGRWNQEENSAPMLLAKCCHDLDLIAWFMSGHSPVYVSSFGSRQFFRVENAPEGSGERCLAGCEIEPACNYSARAIHIEQNLFGRDYAWKPLQHIPHPTIEEKMESLRTDNPLGRCVWRCDNDVVDHQTVSVEFDNGATASHNMVCSSRATRTIHIVGEKGEIEGDMEGQWIKIRTAQIHAKKTFEEENISMKTPSDSVDAHGGGDARLIADFERALRGESSPLTRIEDSLTGHLIGFAAETSRKEKRVVTIHHV